MISTDSAKVESDATTATESTSVQKQPASGPPPPPDGGFTAWLQCAAGFCVFFNTWGLLNSFGMLNWYTRLSIVNTL
jgi:hypothetical protein